MSVAAGVARISRRFANLAGAEGTRRAAAPRLATGTGFAVHEEQLPEGGVELFCQAAAEELARQQNRDRLRQQRDERLQRIVAAVDGDQAPPLIATPSAMNLFRALSPEDAALPSRTPDSRGSGAAGARAQRVRTQLRLLDAELAEVRAELLRAEVLRGPSGMQFECDGNCIVGGCGDTFAEEEGVLCSGSCGLFLCHACFGDSIITNETQ